TVAGRWLHVNLFPPGITDVANPQVAGGPVKGEAPWVAESVRPDLSPSSRLADEWVVGRNRIRLRRVDVDAQNFAVHRAQQLGLLRCFVVTHRDVQVAVRSELQGPTVVVLAALGDRHDRRR